MKQAAAVFCLMIWYAGIMGAETDHQTFGRYWREVIWPAYISYIEVGKYFNAYVQQ